MMSAEKLKEALINMGVEITGEESYKELQALYKENKVVPTDDTMSDEEIAKQEAELRAQMASQKGDEKAMENGSKATTMIPLSQVEEMMRKFATEFEAKMNKKIESKENEEIEPEKFDKRIVRIPYIDVKQDGVNAEKKFVIGFKNMNSNDEYDDSEKMVIELVKKENDIVTKTPWVTLILEDGTEQMYPLLPFMDRAVGVPFELVETKFEDQSYSLGKTEKAELGDDGYSYKSSGVFVDMKVTKKKPTFIVKHPVTNKVLTVQREVVNLVPDKTKK